MEEGLTEQIAAESSLELGRRSISSGFSYLFMIAEVALTTSYARDHPLFLTIAGTVMTLIGVTRLVLSRLSDTGLGRD